MAQTNEHNHLEIIVAILIATVTVIGAVVVWRASVAADASGDADYAGHRASVNVEETRALDTINTYENYGAYTNYVRYSTLSDLIAEDLDQATADEALRLEHQLTEADNLAVINQNLFPNRFLNRDGTYNIQRQLGELWAKAAKEKDLNPEPQFAEADRLRDKSNWFLVAVTILAISLVFYTLVESVSGRGQIVLVTLGCALALVGTIGALFIEFGM